jgi:dihydropteroate synthase
LLGVSAQDALPGTVALNMAALLNGASILRVHDVKEAVQAVRLSQALKGDLKEL